MGICGTESAFRMAVLVDAKGQVERPRLTDLNGLGECLPALGRLLEGFGDVTQGAASALRERVAGVDEGLCREL